jgi:hypothetical protein
LRIQSRHRDIAPEIAADGLKDLFEHSWIQKERGPGIKAKSVFFNGSTPAADSIGSFEQSHLGARLSHQHGIRQPTRTRTDDRDLLPLA